MWENAHKVLESRQPEQKLAWNNGSVLVFVNKLTHGIKGCKSYHQIASSGSLNRG